jgi:hypothetical protein
MLSTRTAPRAARVPSSYTRTIHREALGVEVFADAAGCVVMGFSAKRQKADFHFRFNTKERADAHVSQWLEGLEQRNRRKVDEKAQRKATGNQLAVGDVLRASWGYDQTNVDYYEVTRLVGAYSVEVREINSHSQGEDMTGLCLPCPGEFIGEPRVYRVIDGNSVKVRSYGVYARKKECKVIGGLKVFEADRWTAYA